MITSNITDTLEIPNEPGTTITIRMLSHGALKKARDTRLYELARMLGGIKLPTTSPEEERADKEAADKEEEEDPLVGYDITTVLHKGIKSWSYPEKCNPETIDELDDKTADFVAKAIIKLSQRTKKQGEVSSV